MIRQTIPNDNSCLFTAVDFLVENGSFTPGAAESMRSHCIDKMLSQPDIYDETRLGMNPQEYFAWLQKWTSWGGENEILVLAELKNVQISVVSLQSLSILTYSPPEGSHCTGRIYLLYNGQHYDALKNADGKTIFPTDTADHESVAIECAKTLKADWDLKLRTRLRKRIQCKGCGAIVANGDAFQLHCTEVEHDEDFSYDCDEIDVSEVVENPTDD